MAPEPEPEADYDSADDWGGDADEGFNDYSIDGTATRGSGQTMALGGAASGAAPQPTPVPQAQKPRRPANYTIRQMSEGVFSLPPGADFEFRNVERDFSYSGRIIYCPTPRHSSGGFDYAYTPERKKTIVSDGNERRIPLATAKFPAELMYEIVAPLEEKAYLRATVKNDARRPLLAGESFIFLDDDFVGRAFMKTVATNEELDLSLGVDEDVKVERKLEETAENKGVISKKERTEYDVKVTVKSYKKRAVKVRVRDQVPTTWQKDDIKIEDVAVKPKPSEKEDRGMYEWEAEVKPGKTQEFELHYVVVHPRDFELMQRREAR